ncbi:hypothetical protein GGI43DRAFT_212008 [Trichoderma evansii]
MKTVMERATQPGCDPWKMRRDVLLCVAGATLKRDFEVESKRRESVGWKSKEERLASSRQTEAASNSVMGLVPFGPRQDSARGPRKTRQGNQPANFGDA